MLKAAAGNVGTLEYRVTIIVIGKNVKRLLTVLVAHDGIGKEKVRIVIQGLNRFRYICPYVTGLTFDTCAKYKTEF